MTMPPPPYGQQPVPDARALPAGWNPYGRGPGEPFDGAAGPDDLDRPLYGAAFGQAVRRFFRSYARFTGRASLSEYWYAQLFLFLVSLGALLLTVVGIVLTPLLASAGGGEALGVILSVLGGLVLFAFSLGTLIPSLAITWRRLHDAGYAGPFYFLSLVPFGDIVVFVFTLLPSKPEGRRYDLPRFPPMAPPTVPPMAPPASGQWTGTGQWPGSAGR
jgi:uncharacterized membrane protein YhaH (DUF805 family)